MQVVSQPSLRTEKQLPSVCSADGSWEKSFSKESLMKGGIGTLADLRSETEIISAFSVLLQANYADLITYTLVFMFPTGVVSLLLLVSLLPPQQTLSSLRMRAFTLFLFTSCSLGRAPSTVDKTVIYVNDRDGNLPSLQVTNF